MKELENYKNLNNLLEKYNKAINNRSNQVTLSTIELGLILQDITRLSVSVTLQNNTNDQLVNSINMLTEIIKSLSEEDSGF